VVLGCGGDSKNTLQGIYWSLMIRVGASKGSADGGMRVERKG
jgi:hypothetical protein